MNNPFVKYLGKEDLLQNKVMTYLQTKYPDIYVIHVPNEGKRTPFMQFKFKYLGGKRGIPDILIFHQNKKNKCGLAIELKVGYNKPTKNQFEALESLKKANWECHWLNDYEKTIQIINEYFK
jgi:aryl-alcohol dehydrogenase-like predicted oxidoreductase